MNSKENFDKKVEERVKEIDNAIANDNLTDEEISALEEAKLALKDTKQASDNAEYYFEKLDERNKLIDKWKADTEYEYIKNMDIINDTIDAKLRNTFDDWCEVFQGENIVNKSELVDIVKSIKYDDLLMKDIVELKTEVKKSTQAISNHYEYCVVIDYIFRMDENMAMHKIWIFDITDIIRSKKMDWLFD